jgi:septal ring factor EnvC (AmiA/AmiB activator)
LIALPLVIFWIVLATIDPIFGVLVVGLVGPVGAYLVAAHRMSGKIATTEAAQLWAESASIREWSAARIDKCDQEILRLNTELDKTKAELEVAKKEIRRLEGLLNEREDRDERRRAET